MIAAAVEKHEEDQAGYVKKSRITIPSSRPGCDQKKNSLPMAVQSRLVFCHSIAIVRDATGETQTQVPSRHAFEETMLTK
jgi:hypothetical protein